LCKKIEKFIHHTIQYQMASIDDYKGMTYSILDRRQIKKLLGAMSNMYDRQLEKSGVDPKELRNLEGSFTSRCRPISERVYSQFRELRNISFNYFHSVDTYDVPDGWTDYGDQDWSHTGLRIESPFRIIAVEFRQYIDPIFGEDTLTFESERQISSLEAFHMMGAGAFRKIAEVEEWEPIIRSF
jgi:hypothetical protein